MRQRRSRTAHAVVVPASIEQEAPLVKAQRLAAERDALWHNPKTCVVCTGKARHGAIVGGRVVPLCSRHIAAWDSSAEQRRAAAIRELAGEDGEPRELRAFMDWLGRVTAEKRSRSAT